MGEELRPVENKLTLLVHFVAQQKRQYNFALYAFVKGLLEKVPELSLKHSEEVKIEALFGPDENENRLIARLLIFGLLVDGTLSVKERLTIRKVVKEEWFPLTVEEMDAILKAYVEGEGLKKF